MKETDRRSEANTIGWKDVGLIGLWDNIMEVHGLVFGSITTKEVTMKRGQRWWRFSTVEVCELSFCAVG